MHSRRNCSDKGTLDFGVRYFTETWASGGPQGLSAGCALPESEVIAKFPGLCL